mgnify:CR=1 FL=1
MTKLAEWLVLGITLVTIWYNFLIGRIPSALTRDQILFAPFIFVGIVAIAVLAVLVRRVQTFKDSPEAAEELRKQVIQAKEDLASKGFKFD